MRATTARRGPAREAALLYEETAESRQARERQAVELQLAEAPIPNLGGRPSKRDRRRYEQLRRRRGVTPALGERDYRRRRAVP